MRRQGESTMMSALIWLGHWPHRVPFPFLFPRGVIAVRARQGTWARMGGAWAARDYRGRKTLMHGGAPEKSSSISVPGQPIQGPSKHRLSHSSVDLFSHEPVRFQYWRYLDGEIHALEHSALRHSRIPRAPLLGVLTSSTLPYVAPETCRLSREMQDPARYHQRHHTMRAPALISVQDVRDLRARIHLCKCTYSQGMLVTKLMSYPEHCAQQK